MKNGVQKGGTSTGLDGSFTIKPIDPGTYTVKATFVDTQLSHWRGNYFS